MPRNPIRIAWDSNLALPVPLRVAHVLWLPIGFIVTPIWLWASDPVRRQTALPLVLGLIAVLVLLPYDAGLSAWAGSLSIGGDLRREIEYIQQFGGITSIALVAIAIWLLDPARRGRLLDWLAAAAGSGLVILALKMLIGRPRPKLGHPEMFLGPFGAFPLGPDVGVRHAWEFWAGISSDLWSMPSSHTASAVVMAVALGWLYPRLRPLMIAMPIAVGLSRVLVGAHYPSDIVAGAAVAYVIARRAMARRWGMRLLRQPPVTLDADPAPNAMRMNPPVEPAIGSVHPSPPAPASHPNEAEIG